MDKRSIRKLKLNSINIYTSMFMLSIVIQIVGFALNEIDPLSDYSRDSSIVVFIISTILNVIKDTSTHFYKNNYIISVLMILFYSFSVIHAQIRMKKNYKHNFLNLFLLGTNLILCNRLFQPKSTAIFVKAIKENLALTIIFIALNVFAVMVGFVIKELLLYDQIHEKEKNHKTIFDYFSPFSNTSNEEIKTVKQSVPYQDSETAENTNKDDKNTPDKRTNSRNSNFPKTQIDNATPPIFSKGISWLTTIVSIVCVFLYFWFCVKGGDEGSKQEIKETLNTILNFPSVSSPDQDTIINSITSFSTLILFAVFVIMIVFVMEFVLKTIVYFVSKNTENDSAVKMFARRLKVFFFDIFINVADFLLFIPDFLELIQDFLFELDANKRIEKYFPTENSDKNNNYGGNKDE